MSTQGTLVGTVPRANSQTGHSILISTAPDGAVLVKDSTQPDGFGLSDPLSVPQIIGSTSLAAGSVALTVVKSTSAVGTAATARLFSYSPSLELLNKDSTQNWFVGLSDDDAKALYLGTGYGPGQGLQPALTIGAVNNIVAIGAKQSELPASAGLFFIDSKDSYGQNDGTLWIRRSSVSVGSVANHVRLQHLSGAVTPQSVLSGMVSRGTIASPTAVMSGDQLLILDGRGYDGGSSNWTEYALGWSDGCASIILQASENWSNSTHGTQILFLTNPTGTGGHATQLERLRILPSGAVSIAATAHVVDAAAEGLFVYGKFGCNTATPQAAAASGGALPAYATGAFGLDTNAHMLALYNLVANIRNALVANGIMS